MEAITTVPATDEHPAGHVIEDEAGFMLHDRVLQASRVVVAADSADHGAFMQQ